LTEYDQILYILSKDLIQINKIEQNTIYLNKSGKTVTASFSVKLIGLDPHIKHLAFT